MPRLDLDSWGRVCSGDGAGKHGALPGHFGSLQFCKTGGCSVAKTRKQNSEQEGSN